jgi:parvulin-like peptidyl-prolyl isomerase
MTRKIACILAFLGLLAASVQAQESVSKPTKADVVKVVKIISADKAKIGTYCKLSDLGDDIKNASSAGDNSKVRRLIKQADDLGKTLGPEFIRLNAGLEDVDLQSKEGQEVSAEFDKLDKLCPAK